MENVDEIGPRAPYVLNDWRLNITEWYRVIIYEKFWLSPLDHWITNNNIDDIIVNIKKRVKFY